MRLLSVGIQNYRVHRDASFSFEDDLVLIHGPNESGKSTLAEAIHSALFLKAKGTTELHERMRSNLGGEPTVCLEFEARGRRHRLTKVFGGKGNATLDTVGQPALNGDAAEEELARLLGVEGPVGGRGAAGALPKRWAHLWVWQGQSSGSPIDSLGEAGDRLRAQLQSRAGQEIVSSPTDAAVIESLQQLVDATFTSTGRPKAGSDLLKAEEALARAKEVLAQRQTTLEGLRQAAEIYEQACSDEERHRRSLADAERQLKKIRQKQEAVRERREQLKERVRDRESLEKEIQELGRADQEIRNLETDIASARKAAEPVKERVEALETALRERKKELESIAGEREEADKALQQARAAADACQAHLNFLVAKESVEELQSRLKKIAALQSKRKALEERLAPLDGLTAKTVRELRKKSSAKLEAKARLEAYALDIELLEADQDVILDGEAFRPGESRMLSRAGELRVGQGVRFRLRPGGAEDLREAQEAASAAEAAFEEALRDLGVSSLEEAEEKRHEREALARDLKSILEELAESEADTIGEELDKASAAMARSAARRDALAKNGQLGGDLPADRRAVEERLGEAEEAREKAAAKSESATATEKAARKAVGKAETELAKARKEYQERSEQARDAEIRLKVAKEKAGNAQARAKAIHQLQAKLDQASAAESHEMEELSRLGPEQLELDRERLEKSLEKDRGLLAHASERRIAAQAELKSSGASDPESEAKEAAAEVVRLERRHASLARQADVRRHLLERLKAVRQATTAALARPLEEAVADYLQILFEGGGRAKLRWTEDGGSLEGFEIDRTRSQNGLYAFDQLSYGTREQTSLALRLAMAELLAADHDGCLPLVLDDAFTHADQGRIEKLKTLIYRASRRGLQILLLTCHPENYSGLSASEIPISKGVMCQ